MEVKDALILDADEPLSKALNEILRTGTAVIIMKNRSYLGLIDDRNIRLGITDVSKAKCEHSCVKTPVLYKESTILDKLNAFLTGHFKALPVVDIKKSLPLGLITRIEVLKDLLALRLIPRKSISEVMKTPAYTIDINSTLANAKTKMKELGTHRLVVLKDSYPYGILSTFDMAAILKPKGRRGERFITEVDKEGDMPLSELLREGLTVVNKDSQLEDAIKKMIEHTSPSLLVVSNNKPVGLLAALDIFKEVLDLSKEHIDISISGLTEDDQQYHEDVRKTIMDTLDKFSKSFTIVSVSLHIKKNKSVYIAKILVDLDKDRLSVSAEDYKLNDTIAKLSKEVYTLLNKKKGIVKNRKKSRIEE